MKLLKMLPSSLLAMGVSLIFSQANAQLSLNPDKFLGNITTNGRVNPSGIEYANLWNQLTPENESKWASVEGTRGRYNWTGCDNAYKYAKDHGFPFKFHTLVWGSQFPNWVRNLSAEDRYQAIEKWMDAVKERYPDLKMIDVVNEAVAGHQQDTYLFEEALGGAGKSGYDWIVKAFEMAHERWPEAILIYNDFNTFQWQIDQFIDLVKSLRDAGAPIDAYGCQSHDVTDMSESKFKAAMDKIQKALQMPMYSTEYDIGSTSDDYQLQRYKEQIPYMWEADYCAGVTLWGYIYGSTWINNDKTGERGISGIIKNGKERPAMTWLREYMASDAAKNAKSPFPGMVKEASVYIKPSSIQAEVDNKMFIDVRASMRTKTIDHVDLYVKGEKVTTMTSAPYVYEYTPTAEGSYELKAVVVATDGTEYTRMGGFKGIPKRIPFKEMTLPGVVEVEDFDISGEGLSFHDSDKNDEGKANYRKDNGGVDIVACTGGYALGYTAKGEWTEYTVNVTDAGEYEYVATVSSGSDNSGFKLSLVQADGSIVDLTNKISVPNGGTWDTYTTVTGKLKQNLELGEQILHLTITDPYCNIDKIELKCTTSGIEEIASDAEESVAYDLSGQKVGEGYKGVFIRNGKKYIK